MTIGTEKEKRSITVIRPICELQEWNRRMENILEGILETLAGEGVEITLVEKASELDHIALKGKRIIFAISLSEAGVNMEYYRLLEFFRARPDFLEGAAGGIVVDGQGEFFTKALARRLAFTINAAGCTLPGRPLVEATGSLGNFHVLSGVTGESPETVYAMQMESLVRRVMDFDFSDTAAAGDKLKILAVHASSRKTSNTLLLWDKVRKNLEDRAEITEISLREGNLQECRGCGYEQCFHFGENGKCFYGGIMTEQVYPAIINCDVLVMICPNYNDALNANLTAFINRLTSIFRVHDFSRKRMYALVVSGYSGGDIVSEQIIGALNFNKGFILPGRFVMNETANDPMSILEISDIDRQAEVFADNIR